MRQRVPLVFMAVSVAATLALGGAIAYQFAHQQRSTAVQQAAAPLQPATGGVKAQTRNGEGDRQHAYDSQADQGIEEIGGR